MNIFARFSHIFFPQGAIFYKNPYSLPELSHCIFNGKTPLHAAVKADNAEAIRLLIESDTNFMIPNQHGQTPIEYAIALKKEKSIAVFNTILINQLFDAAIIHDYPRFKELLVQIPNMNTTFDTYNFHKPFDAYNTTLLSELVPLPSKEGFIALLIKAGANVNTCIKYENGDKIFPLHIAVNRASTAVCKMLLDAGARPNTKSVCPLLSLALGKNIDKKIELIQLLIKYGTLVKKHHINMEHSIPRSIQRASSCYGDQYLMELKRFLQQTMDTQQCCICYENVNDMYDIPCKNRHINSFVCSVCYPALHKICPLCRAEIGEYGS